MAVTGSLIGSNAQDGLFIGSNAQNTIPSGVYVVAVAPPPAASVELPPITQLQSGLFMKPTLPLSSTLLFLLLVALYSFLLWRGLSGGVSPRFFWLYFVFQGLLVLAMQRVVEQPNLTMNFYLALTLCALAMFKRVVPVLLIATSYLLLFFVSLSISIPFGVPLGMHLAALWFSIWSFSDLMTIVFFVLGYLILYMQQSQSQVQLEQAHRELQAAHRRLAASTRQIETLTLLTERQRMARELHDTLAQGIAGMIMQLEVTSAQMDRKNYLQAQQILGQALSCARTTLRDARHAITDLRSRTPRIDQLVESVQQEITHFFQTTGIVCHAHLDNLVHTPPHHCDHVLRVIGEGLSNVARHAQARQVSVEVRVVERWLEITVRDDGQGFDPANQDLHAGHYGLLGLQERAHLVEGTLSLSSSDGEGTTLRFRIPLATSCNPAPSLKQEESQSSLILPIAAPESSCALDMGMKGAFPSGRDGSGAIRWVIPC
jgi:NarL family two-component system sensor histidine kinase YdfH